MSDNWINLIPENPGFVPAAERQLLAEAKCRELSPHADEVRSLSSPSIQFRDCGANFETIACPHCGGALPIDWWQNAMDEDFGGDGFSMNPQQLPCCGKSATLHELTYHFPQGFGKYVLQMVNPDLGEISPVKLLEFEGILGCKLRVIYRHS